MKTALDDKIKIKNCIFINEFWKINKWFLLGFVRPRLCSWELKFKFKSNSKKFITKFLLKRCKNVQKLSVEKLQGLTWPAMYAIVGYWIPPHERSRFMSSFQGEFLHDELDDRFRSTKGSFVCYSETSIHSSWFYLIKICFALKNCGFDTKLLFPWQEN